MAEDRNNSTPDNFQAVGPELSHSQGVQHTTALPTLTSSFKEFMANEENNVEVERIILLLGKNKEELKHETVEQVDERVKTQQLEATERVTRNMQMGEVLEIQKEIEAMEPEHLDILSQCIPGVFQAIDEALEEYNIGVEASKAEDASPVVSRVEDVSPDESFSPSATPTPNREGQGIDLAAFGSVFVGGVGEASLSDIDNSPSTPNVATPQESFSLPKRNN